MHFDTIRPLAVVLLSLASGAAADDAPSGRVADDDLVAWTNAEVAERQPLPSERRFDEIGWAPDIRTALRLAREHDRPVFVFTMDGRINIGRC